MISFIGQVTNITRDSVNCPVVTIRIVQGSFMYDADEVFKHLSDKEIGVTLERIDYGKPPHLPEHIDGDEWERLHIKHAKGTI